MTRVAKPGEAEAGVIAALSSHRDKPLTRESWLKLRSTTVGASEVPALFGIHKHMTPFQLYSMKRGEWSRDFDETVVTEDEIHLPPTERGHVVEPVAFDLVRRLRPGWVVVANQIPGGWIFRDPYSRMSATPDGFLYDAGRPGVGDLQVKSMTEEVFERDWRPNEQDVEVPLSVAVQAIVEATLADCQWAYVAAIVFGHGISLYLREVPLHAGLMKRARELVDEFWLRVAESRPYDPDFARDGEAIAAVYAEAAGEVDLSLNPRILELLTQREGLKLREKDGAAAQRARAPLDAEIIHMLGNAESGRLADGRRIEAKTIRRKGYAVAPSTYRTVRLTDERQDNPSRRRGDRTQPAFQYFSRPF